MKAFTNYYDKISRRRPLSFWLWLIVICGMLSLLLNLISGDFGDGFIVDKWLTVSFLLFIIVVAIVHLKLSMSNAAATTTQDQPAAPEQKSPTLYVVKKPRPGSSRIVGQNSELNTEDILDQIPSLIWVGDHEGHRTWFNRHYTEFTGGIPNQGHAEGWLDSIHPDDRKGFQETRAGNIGNALPFSHEYRLRHKNGAFKTIIDYANPIHNGDGQLEGYIGFCIDITERERAFRELAISEEKFFKAFHASPEVVTISKLEGGTLIEVNRTFENVMGFSATEVKGKTAEEIGVWDDVDERETYRQTLQVEGRIRNTEIHMRTKSAGVVVLLASAEILVIEGDLCVLSVAMDITERKKIEDELRLSRNNLQELTSMLTHAEEKERRKIAVDLHDNIVQNLGLLKIRCGQLSVSDLADDARELLQSITSVVEDTIKASRDLIHELSPPVLNELGFEAALRWLAEQMSARYKINYDVSIENIESVPDSELQSTLFRIAREIMTNAGKYSSASSVNCSFRDLDKCLELRVVDDGVGFDTHQVEARGLTETGGFGLFAIRQTLESVNGSLQITSESGNGTCVTVSIPTDQT